MQAPGPVRQSEASMIRSRAVSAPEPGQDREVAALRDTACAPRGSRIGAQDWRARPEPTLEGGCPVRFPSSFVRLEDRAGADQVAHARRLALREIAPRFG